jgi:exopolysaccharide production protein ExoZ
MKHYPIQYLRAIAAMLVVFEHFKIYPFADNLLSGTIGVDIFYIISGFIMSINIEKYIDKKYEFVINRFVRIYPLYIILTIPLVYLYLHNNSIDVLTVFPSLYLIGSFSADSYKDPILYSGWTLVYEFIFYGLIIAFARDRKITLAVLCVMGLVGLVFSIPNQLGYFFNQFYFLFAMGMLLHQVLKSKILEKYSVELLTVSAILLVGVMLLSDRAVAGDANYIPRQYIGVWGKAMPRILVWGLPSAFFVVSFYVFFINRPSIPWLNELGNMSFSIYLVHTFLFQVYNYLIGCYDFLNNRLFIAFIFIMIFPMSKLTYEFVEIRFNRWLKHQLA